jgi:hypothetical protein
MEKNLAGWQAFAGSFLYGLEFCPLTRNLLSTAQVKNAQWGWHRLNYFGAFNLVGGGMRFQS